MPFDDDRGPVLEIEVSQLDSPIGELSIAFAEEGLLAIEFAEKAATLRARLQRLHPGARFGRVSGTDRAVERLGAYFFGELDALGALAVAPKGTPFQQRVWAALRTIPVGQTRSYRDVAREIGAPAAVRAVGAANGQNPIPLVLPCHRVIASDGTLCGYGGGLWRKKWLLNHERRNQLPLIAAIAER